MSGNETMPRWLDRALLVSILVLTEARGRGGEGDSGRRPFTFETVCGERGGTATKLTD
jgi:hypothetical protein